MHAETFEAIEARLNTPGSTAIVVHKKERVQLTPRAAEDLFCRQREHWKKLHTQTFNETTFEEWVRTIPGCPTCQRNFRVWLETNPPRFDDWRRWTFEAHNAVNRKLGKPEILWEKACELWGWEAGIGQKVDLESTRKLDTTQQRRHELKEKGRVLWRELFLSVFSSSDLAAWEARIPGYQCGGRCKKFYTNWKSSHIPSFPLSFEWKHSLKSAVNQKLGHPNLALEEARAFWNSQSGT